MKGKLKDLTRNLDGTWNLAITLGGDCRAIWDKYREKDVDVEVKQYREKRSLDVGRFTPIPIKEEAVERWCENWSSGGTGWFCDIVDNSKFKGYKLIHAYYGTSTYDSKEMSIIIDYLVDDAEQMGIPIPLGKDEMERLKADWRAHEQKHPAR